jgi:hypothetical protein
MIKLARDWVRSKELSDKSKLSTLLLLLFHLQHRAISICWYTWHPCTHLGERTTSLTSILLIFWMKLFLGEHLAHEDKWHPKFAFA